MTGRAGRRLGDRISPRVPRPRTEPPREPSTLLPKVLLAAVAVLTVAAIITLVVETGIARQQLSDEALALSNDRGETLARRVQQEGASTRQQLLTLVQQLQLDTRDEAELERGLLETLALTRVSGDRAEVAGIIDVRSGALRASLPGRAALLDPGPLTFSLLGATPESSTRVVPITDDGYALVHVQTLGRLELGPSMLAIGYPLDDGRARSLRDDLGVDDVEVVVDGTVVAATSHPADGRPAADPEVRQQTQQASDGRLVRYVTIGTERDWDTPAFIGVISDDPLAALNRALTRTRLFTLALLIVVGAGLALAAARALTRPISDLTTTASAIAGGDLERPFTVPDRQDELGTLARALEEMRRELRAQLRVIAEQAGELQEAARRIVGAQDRERQRVALDLHDGLQHQLVVLRMQAGALRDRCRDDRDLAESCEELAGSIDQILDQVRSTGHRLFPSILRDRGLAAALHSLAARSEIPVEVILDPDPLPRAEEDVEVAAYFIIAEAVTNALRHAAATTITVAATLRDDHLRLEVSDDGRGFEVSEHLGNGTVHLRDRATALGGRLHLRSEPGQGTRVTAHLPRWTSVGGSLEEEQDGGDPSVEIGLLGQPELAEDRVGVLLDGAFRDRQPPRDGGVPPT